MNLIATDLRSVLLVTHVSALMFIRINGPPLQKWSAEKYVDSWQLRHRSASDTGTRSPIAAPITDTAICGDQIPHGELFESVFRTVKLVNLSPVLLSAAQV